MVYLRELEAPVFSVSRWELLGWCRAGVSSQDAEGPGVRLEPRTGRGPDPGVGGSWGLMLLRPGWG